MISSPVATIVVKFVWPAGWLLMVGYQTVRAFTDPSGVRWGPGVDPAWGRALLIALLVLGLWIAVFVSAPTRRVRLSGRGLLVSNYWREIRVPWTEVERVIVHGRFGRRRSAGVELRLARSGLFGRRILLYPASPDALARLRAAAGPGVEWTHR